jgi:hypothetical protein
MPVRIDASAPPSVPESHGGPVPPPPIAERHMYEFDPALNPRAETQRINLANRRLDNRDYEAYVDRYIEGLKGCRTEAEVRAYGDPAWPPARMPANLTVVEAEQFNDLRWSALGDTYRAAQAQGDLLFRLAGITVPLSVELQASAQATLAVGNRQVGAGVSIGKNGVTADAVFGAKGQKLTLSGGPNTALTAGRQVGVPGAMVTTSGGERLDRLELEAYPLQPVSPFVAGDGRSVELGLRAGRLLKKGPVQVGVEGRASVKVNLLSAEAVRYALFGRPSGADSK